MERERAERTFGDKELAACEILSVVFSILIAEWVVASLAEGSKLIAAIPVGSAFVFMLFSHALRSEGLKEIGFRRDNFAAALGVLAIPTLAAIACMLIVGWLTHTLKLESFATRPRFLALPLWALAQQYVTQGFINRRVQILFGRGWRGVLLVGLIFGLLHLPNFNLVWITFVGGVVWAAAYQRAPNLFALALSHTVCAILLAKSVPPSWLNSLRVGLKYFL